ncbi:Apo-citrate lyase phosphoribosyl-dephospho-CoA transferase [Clostridium homopropionicum DSM 5847]|uniref:citrate lyase holo-[acyl-carrier protein] synthase n=1 Tax=Clostridium homopropionicum DSM 5847 TaxID=1121318 RepID=A0A0L6ZA63_9CLOT|nr:citrate lyase holo-[acyl-carrier protein] synthase [Clostridium homopropionicum]KOA19861.1 Apo-citrate lyase phosphoribosyl-dephospho-CoA transferase [Clostridium homopropionicum DSM 5847]SFF75850.1 holo-ACP synthase [Clostridium homopropionicum]
MINSLENNDKKNTCSFINKLIRRYNMPYILMKVNYPGTNKSNEITNSIIENLDDIMSDIFSPFIVFKSLRITEEGPVVTFVLDKDPMEIKKTTVEIEDKHILGDCVNIDVYDKDMNKITRQLMGYPPRKCFICDGTAKNCMKKNAHGNDRIIQYVVGKYREYMENFHGKKV